MLMHQNSAISSVAQNNYFTMFNTFSHNKTGNDQSNNDYPFNIAFNIIDSGGPNNIDRSRYGKLVLTTKIWNFVD